MTHTQCKPVTGNAQCTPAQECGSCGGVDCQYGELANDFNALYMGAFNALFNMSANYDFNDRLFATKLVFGRAYARHLVATDGARKASWLLRTLADQIDSADARRQS